MAPHLSMIPDLPVGVVFTCTECEHTFEPSFEDFDTGRTGCPDPDCGGWTLVAELTIGGAR